ncbi:methyltransferase domain-containing protein [bacterium]|nr:methyltransferase domain-containing protein [bacterium]
MKSLEESVTESLDGSGTGILKFLPYLLRDIREIGSDPDTMAGLIREHIRKDNPRVLDLGCGKGAVSVRVAQEKGCIVKGIDALPDFIKEAEEWARQCNVVDRCSFEVGDIRIRINEMRGFDVIILGAIGPVFGDLEVSLNSVRSALNFPGYILLDDGYIEDDLDTDYNRALRKSEFFRQIDAAGFTVVHEEIFRREGLSETDAKILDSIALRAAELTAKYPEHSDLFQGYVENQVFENRILETVITTGTWLLMTSTGK